MPAREYFIGEGPGVLRGRQVIYISAIGKWRTGVVVDTAISHPSASSIDHPKADDKFGKRHPHETAEGFCFILF